MKRFIGMGVLAVVCSTVFADSITLKSGVAITECTILQANAEHVVLLYGTGIIRIDRRDVNENEPLVTVTELTRPIDPVDDKKQPTATPNHLPDYGSIAKMLGRETWATDLQQIPATVVSLGIMRNVPYKSHLCGDNYEVNVYGDPKAPAGFEIGIKKGLLNDEKAKAHCVDFVCSLLKDSADRDALRAMKMTKDLITRNGVTYEITPATDADAYGGWWISVYSEAGLNAVRASDKEIAAITVPKAAPQTPLLPPVNQSAALNEIERRNAWTDEEMRRARVVRNEPPNHDRVYSRDFTRHEGVYVPHHHRTIVVRR
jgi:hypothetical protein